MNDELNRKVILIIKYATSVMDLIASLIPASLIASAVVLCVFTDSLLSKMTGMLSEGADPSSPASGYVVLGEVFGLFFSIGAEIVAYLLAAICVIAAIWFLIPSVHGFITCRSVRKHNGTEAAGYRRSAVRDSIVKIIFSVLPAAGLIAETEFSALTVSAVAYLTAITAAEIAVLCLIYGNKGRKDQ